MTTKLVSVNKKGKYEMETYCNSLSDSKVGLPVPSTKSTSAWAFFILLEFCNKEIRKH